MGNTNIFPLGTMLYHLARDAITKTFFFFLNERKNHHHHYYYCHKKNLKLVTIMLTRLSVPVWKSPERN